MQAGGRVRSVASIMQYLEYYCCCCCRRRSPGNRKNEKSTKSIFLPARMMKFVNASCLYEDSKDTQEQQYHHHHRRRELAVIFMLYSERGVPVEPVFTAVAMFMQYRVPFCCGCRLNQKKNAREHHKLVHLPPRTRFMVCSMCVSDDLS